ncbi:hypothetical protein LX36DRAFT_669907 [Colletotrichum falcatum]|nr:hypothetical protein LX36DRAFT_669907 [Colletotrichum falcatum]
MSTAGSGVCEKEREEEEYSDEVSFGRRPYRIAGDEKARNAGARPGQDGTGQCTQYIGIPYLPDEHQRGRSQRSQSLWPGDPDSALDGARHAKQWGLITGKRYRPLASKVVAVRGDEGRRKYPQHSAGPTLDGNAYGLAGVYRAKKTRRGRWHIIARTEKASRQTAQW